MEEGEEEEAKKKKEKEEKREGVMDIMWPIDNMQLILVIM